MSFNRAYLDMCQRIYRRLEEGDILLPHQKRLIQELNEYEVAFLGRSGRRDTIRVKKERSNDSNE